MTHPRTHTRQALILATGLAIVACASHEKPGRAGANADSADMAHMPGMTGTRGTPGSPAPRTDRDAADVEAPAVTLPAAITFTPEQVKHGGVRWTSAAAGQASETAIVPGQVVPNEDRTARLGAPVQGRVMTVRVRPGDPVQLGQVLVTLESPEAGSAQAEAAKGAAMLASARAQREYARSTRARAERLLALKAIPQQDYERAIADDELARASLTEAEAEARRSQAAATQLGAGLGIAAASGQVEIRSPLAGVVLARTAIPGTVVEAGMPLVIVTDATHLWLTVSAPEQLAGLFRAGAPLRFTVPAYPTDTFVARIDAVGAGLDPDTRTLPVRAAVRNAAGRLKPEMLASVAVEGARTATAVVLPDSAVQLVAGTPTVFLVTPDGTGGARFTRHVVELGARSNGHVTVTRGLAPGDVVVTAGAFSVKAQIEKASAPAMEM